MIGTQTRRSIVFHLWIRLTAVTAVFTLLAVGVFVWLEIGDNLDAAREHSGAQAIAAARSQANNISSRNPEASREPASSDNTTANTLAPPQDLGESLGIAGIQFLASDGSVTRRVGNLDGSSALMPEELVDGALAARTYDVKLENGGFSPVSISPLNLLLGGEYGAAYVTAFPRPPAERSAASPPEFIRVVLRYDNISGNAQTLLLRSAMLSGGILAVAAATIWVLLNRFVSQPLRAYNATARRIAEGEAQQMPDLGSHEFAELGQTIDDMAAALRRQASVDALTGLYNLRDLRARLPVLLDQARDLDQPLSLVVCDLDNLKPVNDTYGHAAGDLVLRAVADSLTKWAADNAICWRTGGDEFVTVMPDTPPHAAEKLVQQLETSVRSTPLDLPEGPIEIGLSIGTAVYPRDGETLDALLNAADQRMYESKNNKRRSSLAEAV